MIPKSFFTQSEVGKNSPEFLRYKKLLSVYIQTLVNIRREGHSFVQTVQEVRLRQIMKVAATIPWWSAYFKRHGIQPRQIRKLSDLSLLPPIQREILKEVSLDALVSDVEKDPARIQINTTSGSTTGTPFKIKFRKSASLMNVTAHYLEIFQSYGLRLDKLWNKNFVLAFNMFGGERPIRTIPTEFLTYLIADSKGGGEQIDALIQRMVDFGPCILMSHPSELFFLVQKLQEKQLHPQILLCVVIGQMLEPEARQMAEKYLRTKVVSVYGLREQMLTGEECRKYPNAFHMQGERNFLEILDDSGSNVAEGVFGNLTLTGFDNDLMPLIRYQSGDTARIIPENCGCGNPHQLFELEYRVTDVFEFSNGARKGIKATSLLFMREPMVSSIVRYQVRQETLTMVRVLLVLRNGTDVAALKSELEKGLRKAIEMPADVSVEIDVVSSIPSEGKYKTFVPLAATKSSNQR